MSSTGPEERHALKQFSSSELDHSQDAWMNLGDEASARQFLGCAIVALRRLVVSHVADFMNRNGCMLDMFDLDDATTPTALRDSDSSDRRAGKFAYAHGWS
jgi:hypothetical protein